MDSSSGIPSGLFSPPTNKYPTKNFVGAHVCSQHYENTEFDAFPPFTYLKKESSYELEEEERRRERKKSQNSQVIHTKYARRNDQNGKEENMS